MVPGSGGERRGGGVAIGAVCRREGSSSGGVYRVVRAGVVRLVAILVAAARWRFQVVTTRRGCVALRALHGSVQAGQREARRVVIESGVGPARGVVAGFAGLRETSRDVVGHIAAEGLRTVPIRCVAGIASRIRGREIVIVVCVATRARRSDMDARERPAGHGVIECIVRPRDGVVAGGAVGGGESAASRRVRRIVRLLPRGEVATGIATIGRLGCQTIVAANVALRATCDLASGRQLVRIRQWETRGAMVKLPIGPCRNGMACRAGARGAREIRRHVVRNVAAECLCAVPRRLVTAQAISGSQVVIVVRVALSAGRRGMRADQSETGDAVIEAGLVRPGDRVVATGAVADGKRGASAGVNRIVRLLPSREVAAGVAAVRRRNLQVVVIVDVALSASGHLAGRCHLVRVGEWKTGRAVVEGSAGPTRGVVASRALRDGESRCDVIRHAAAECLRTVPILKVASGITAIRWRDL